MGSEGLGLARKIGIRGVGVDRGAVGVGGELGSRGRGKLGSGGLGLENYNQRSWG